MAIEEFENRFAGATPILLVKDAQSILILKSHRANARAFKFARAVGLTAALGAWKGNRGMNVVGHKVVWEDQTVSRQVVFRNPYILDITRDPPYEVVLFDLPTHAYLINT